MSDILDDLTSMIDETSGSYLTRQALARRHTISVIALRSVKAANKLLADIDEVLDKRKKNK